MNIRNIYSNFTRKTYQW